MPSIKKSCSHQTGLKVLIYFFQIFGLFTLGFDGKLRQLRPVASKTVSALIFYIVVPLDLIWCSNSILKIACGRKTWISNFDGIMITIFRLILLIAASIISTIFFYRRRKIIEISKMVAQICHYSISLNSDADRSIRKALKQTIQLLMILTLSIIWITIVFCTDGSKMFCFYLLPTIFNFTIVYACILQYISLILFTNQAFKVLNQILMKIERVISTNTTEVQVIITSESNWAVEKVHELRKFHSQLYELSEKVSNFYSFPIFLCISNLFFSLLHTSYFIIQIMITQEDVSLQRYMYNYIRELLAIFFLFSLNASASSVINRVSKVYITNIFVIFLKFIHLRIAYTYLYWIRPYLFY